MKTNIPKEARLMRAKAIRAGDLVCFEMPTANYVVEEVETDAFGLVRHRFYNGYGAVSYDRWNYLWVVRHES